MGKKTYPFVSIVMPVFTHLESQLNTAIQSILNQTYPYFEFIIVDGNQTDVNLRIIEKIKDKRIIYYRKTGYINCLNFGIKKAKGIYIARMDSDDISYPNRLAEQVRFLEENPDVDMCSCQADLFGDTTLTTTNNLEKMDFLSYIKTGQIIHPAIMFRKSLNIQFEAMKPYEDCLLFQQLLLNGYQIRNINKVLFKNRVNQDSIMARHPHLMKLYRSKIILYSFSQFPHLKGILNFSDIIFRKKNYTAENIQSFLKFSDKMSQSDKINGVNTFELLKPFLDFMLSHSSKKMPLYIQLIKTPVFYKFYPLNKTLIPCIFSIRNKRIDGQPKVKILTFLGLTVKLKTYCKKL